MSYNYDDSIEAHVVPVNPYPLGVVIKDLGRNLGSSPTRYLVQKLVEIYRDTPLKRLLWNTNIPSASDGVFNLSKKDLKAYGVNPEVVTQTDLRIFSYDMEAGLFIDTDTNWVPDYGFGPEGVIILRVNGTPDKPVLAVQKLVPNPDPEHSFIVNDRIPDRSDPIIAPDEWWDDDSMFGGMDEWHTDGYVRYVQRSNGSWKSRGDWQPEYPRVPTNYVIGRRDSDGQLYYAAIDWEGGQITRTYSPQSFTSYLERLHNDHGVPAEAGGRYRIHKGRITRQGFLDLASDAYKGFLEKVEQSCTLQ